MTRKRSLRSAIIARRAAQRRRRRGVALILVLSSLTILTIMLSEIQDESSAELGAALSARDAIIAEYAAESAVNLSRLLIAAEPTIRQQLAPMMMLMTQGSPQIPVWAFADRVLGAFNDEAGAEAFRSLGGLDVTQGKNLGMKNSGFQVQIIDEDSKINLNLPARGDAFSQTRLGAQIVGLLSGAQYDPLFEGRDGEGNFSDRQTICSALVDFTDPDQDTFPCDPQNTTAQQTGAEDSYYELLKRPYHRKNAAFDSLEEVHRARGISDDIWATFMDPDPDRPDKRTVTVWGQGPINVNTANAQTLLAAICASGPTAKICTDPVEAQKYLIMMEMLRGMANGVPFFSSGKAFVNALQGRGPFGAIFRSIGLEPVQLLSQAETEKMLTAESKVFSIYATGYVKAGKRETRVRVHAVVDFRGAPPPEAAAVSAAANALQQNPEAASRAGLQGAADQLAEAQSAIQAAVKPNPGGNVIYYKVE